MSVDPAMFPELGMLELGYRLIARLHGRGDTIRRLLVEIGRLKTKVALLEHEADCYWCEICSPGEWTRSHCPDCERLQKAVEAAEANDAHAPRKRP